MAIRVGDLGGLFSPLARGASPTDDTLQLTLTTPPSHLALPAWFATSWTRTRRWNPYTQHLRVADFSCSDAEPRVHVQADGEWIGTTPMRVELVPERTPPADACSTSYIADGTLIPSHPSTRVISRRATAAVANSSVFRAGSLSVSTRCR